MLIIRLPGVNALPRFLELLTQSQPRTEHLGSGADVSRATESFMEDMRRLVELGFSRLAAAAQNDGLGDEASMNLDLGGGSDMGHLGGDAGHGGLDGGRSGSRYRIGSGVGRSLLLNQVADGGRQTGELGDQLVG